MVRLISRQRGGLAALKLTKLMGIGDFQGAKDSGKVLITKGRSDTHCKIKETLLIQELKPTLNDTVSNEKLYLYVVI